MVAALPRGESPEAVFASAGPVEEGRTSGLTDLLAAVLTARPPWMRDALCAEYSEVNFFPG